MNLLFDTNILLPGVRDYSLAFLEQLNPNNNKAFISVATFGEIKSIALQNNWGLKKLESLNILLDDIAIIEITKTLIDTYAQIDAYSQHRNPAFSNYSFKTARNMGKNDLWIAATAALLGLKLVTTDNDFDHLHEVFFEVQKIKSSDLK
jgi:tRNA(fMet)-specific endonuclease VapC